MKRLLIGLAAVKLAVQLKEEDGPVVLLGGGEERLHELFTDLERVGTVECGDCMPYENHKPVWIGRGMKKPWAQLWPQLKHYE